MQNRLMKSVLGILTLLSVTAGATESQDCRIAKSDLRYCLTARTDSYGYESRCGAQLDRLNDNVAKYCGSGSGGGGSSPKKGDSSSSDSDSDGDQD